MDDDPQDPSRRPRQVVPMLAFGALVLVPFLGLGLFGNLPSSPQNSGPAKTVAGTSAAEVAALPATAEDTVVTSELDAADAKSRNAAVDFASIGPGSARPFRFVGSSADRIRARDCLALAGMAEAGGGNEDQRAVMQVVLNRARHPAFAKTICGVVFEGSQRPTGCQFSFTCDGSLARRYSDAAWRMARARADAMLDGATDATIGNATHFHADYVYPWWSDKLDKVAKVGPHIFFRWRGFWGSGNALSARYRGDEPDWTALRTTAQAVAAANPLPTLLQGGEAVRSITGQSTSSPGPATAGTPPASPGPGVHFVLVARSDSPDALVERARALCPGDRYCQVYGWDDAANIPGELPLSGEARRTLRFSFLPERAGNAETIYVDCGFIAQPVTARCLPRIP
ncbi:cell wall hydrolase [Qipengyuania qiaonensis]|uniref:Cell wall hydrolase n=1 Tax=Qipengyuania qiaonensis TaxID=2867240 RepID=A0ABS7J5I9_9SPHN|nr:cell wall hydrolase [Qipengyuania qiaonensis]MBX7482604.1 cell wall hydrolase [Qipengyuania qiaonensis]